MRDYFDDHSGDDEVHPVGPEEEEDVDSGEQPPMPGYPESPLTTGDQGVYPTPPLHDDPIYHSPTQPVEPVYPVPEDVKEEDEVPPEVVEEVPVEDESLLDRVRRWITGDSIPHPDHDD